MSDDHPGFQGLGDPTTVAERPDLKAPTETHALGLEAPTLRGAALAARPRATGVSVPRNTPVVLLVSSGPPGPGSHLVDMPSLRGHSIQAATRKAARRSLVLQASPTFAPQVRANHVSVQYPPAGHKVLAGSTVSVLISNGHKPPKGIEIPLPDVTGLLSDDAENAVMSAGLRPIVMRTPHSAAAFETVFGQLPNARAVSQRGHPDVGRYFVWLATVAIVGLLVLAAFLIATVPVALPDVRGRDVQSAQQKLRVSGFRIGPVSVMPVPPTALKGRVLTQFPAPGTKVRRGTVILLGVSGTQSQVLVPDVVGLNRRDAQWAVGTVAKYAVKEQSAVGVPKGQVIAQQPVAGTSVSPGTVVTLYISSGK